MNSEGKPSIVDDETARSMAFWKPPPHTHTVTLIAKITTRAQHTKGQVNSLIAVNRRFWTRQSGGQPPDLGVDYESYGAQKSS